MRTGGRLSAAAEILSTLLTHHQPVSRALLDWSKQHRFCGSSDRRAIGDLIYDALRHKNFLTAVMQNESPRALILGTARFIWKVSFSELLEESNSSFGFGDLTPEERICLEGDGAISPSSDPWILGNYQEWLHPFWQRAFGEEALSVTQALAERAPIDIRINTLKTSLDKTLHVLRKFNLQKAPLSPWGARIAAPLPMERLPHLEADLHFQKGWFELQDVASQIAALLVHAQPGMQVLDLCAGSGGKTLSLSAQMLNRGQIFAYDRDRYRLKPIIERLKRAGARNVQVVPSDEEERLELLKCSFDRVLVDAPCSGTGAWRRRPDHKWRFKQEQLSQVLRNQQEICAQAASFVKPGGRMIYATCSLLKEENEDQITGFLKDHSDFHLIDFKKVWQESIGMILPKTLSTLENALTLTPFHHGCDGFFVAILERHGIDCESSGMERR